jgi:gamma-glutamyltranspeptidase
VTNIQILTNLVHRGMELSQAVEAPRWSITQSGDPLLEEEFPDAVLARLRSAGHAVGRAQGASQVGSAKCIERLPNGVLAGAADARREAYACGF